MKLTGQCKEQFEEWFLIRFENYDGTFMNIEDFDQLSPSMKYGVYVDFFDSLGIDINIKKVNSSLINRWMYVLKDMNNYGCHLNDYLKNKRCETRPEARTAAIEKANEIYNNK